MKHIVLLLFILSFLSGMTALVVLSYFYYKNKTLAIKYTIITDISMSILLLCDIIVFYIKINLIQTNTLLIFVVMLLILVSSLVMVYSLAQLIKLLTNQPLVKSSLLYLVVSATLIFLFVLLNILLANQILVIPINYPSSFILHNLVLGFGLFYSLYLFMKFKTQLPDHIFKVYNFVVLFTFIFVPITVIFSVLEHYITFPTPLPFSPIGYFVLNGVGLYLAKNYITSIPQSDEQVQDYKLLIENKLSIHNLTSRENEIVELVVSGKSNQFIADTLFISPNTVKNHIYNAYKKIGVNNRYELMGLINDPSSPSKYI